MHTMKGHLTPLFPTTWGEVMHESSYISIKCITTCYGGTPLGVVPLRIMLAEADSDNIKLGIKLGLNRACGREGKTVKICQVRPNLVKSHHLTWDHQRLTGVGNYGIIWFPKKKYEVKMLPITIRVNHDWLEKLGSYLPCQCRWVPWDGRGLILCCPDYPGLEQGYEITFIPEPFRKE